MVAHQTSNLRVVGSSPTMVAFFFLLRIELILLSMIQEVKTDTVLHIDAMLEKLNCTQFKAQLLCNSAGLTAYQIDCLFFCLCTKLQANPEYEECVKVVLA